MLNILVVQTHIHADTHTHRYTQIPHTGSQSRPPVLRLTGNRAGMRHVQRSGDGNWGCRNLAKWNGHYPAIYHAAVDFFGGPGCIDWAIN